jgi:uroporphyrinogen III methyltransferase / synthase
VTVYLVGAGPGDPGLLTVRGFAVLTGADVVVYDRLASPTLLEVVPAGAELISAGKAPGQVDLTQDEINAVLVDRGRAGATVVRLKGGDPFVFGRGGEEAEALAAAGVPYEVVPGVTSAIGALAYAGIPVTHRGVSTHFTVVTGHEDPTKDRTDVDWDALARVGGTLVILMGAGNIGDIAQRLVDGGLDPATPVAAVRNGTRPDQQTVRATLATIRDAGVRAPSAIVVGDVAALDLGWFESRPLFGRSVVVTRAREQASELRARLEALGAEVLELPTISIEPLDFSVPSLGDFGWLVFTSVNGVDAFFDRGLDPAGLDARALAGLRVAAIGPSTERALLTRGIRIDIAPDRFVAESLLAAFPEPAVTGERVLLVRAEQGRDVLPEGLAASGYAVEVLAVYRTARAEPDADALARVRAGNVDAITFTSSSTVDNLCDLIGAPFTAQTAPQPVVVSIGPATSDTARARGLRVDVEATDHTIDGVVTALLEVLASVMRVPQA